MPIGREDKGALGIGAERRHMSAVVLDVVVKQKCPGADQRVFKGFLLGTRAARQQSETYRQCRNANDVSSMHGSPPLRLSPPIRRSAPHFLARRIGRRDFPYSDTAFNWVKKDARSCCVRGIPVRSKHLNSITCRG